MAVKLISEKPTLADTIRFILKTPDADGCFKANPYKVDSITIFFVARDFSAVKDTLYIEKTYDSEKLAAAIAAEQLECESPSEANEIEAQRTRSEAESNAVSTNVYYKEAIPVKKFGTDDCPAYLRDATPDPSDPCPVDTDTGNAFITNLPTDEEGNTQYGVFELLWEPKGQREGQYFICWTWTPNPAGDSITDHQYFEIYSTPKINSLPQHHTPTDKYETLLDRYTPEMFKTKIADLDLTPTILDKFNKSIADGFTILEDLAVQMIDLFDANMSAEPFLGLLANTFNLILKSDDPTLWRRQIKRAIPLFKRKGTLIGLQEAFTQAGMRLVKLTRLWQIISKYTWVEGLNVETDGQTEFILDRNPILVDNKVDPLNFELYLRPKDSDEYFVLTQDYVEFSKLEAENYTIMTWLGDNLSIDPISLLAGDTLKVVYKIKEVPSEDQQEIENYIRILPLNDQRDERDQEYPLKNWNVRVIEEDDPLFDLVIPKRHPYSNAVVFGEVRTEFPFSENIYNMDEWNGSLRDSTEPCDIDKNFLDCCTDCLGSKFNAIVEIGSLSDTRLIEAVNVFEEYKPFHAILHTMDITGLVEEFVNCNVEDIEVLLTYRKEENIFCGSAQTIFSRTMEHSSFPGNDVNAIRRNALNNLSLVTPILPPTGIVSNEEVVLCAPMANLTLTNNFEYKSDPSGYVPGSNNNRLEILSPSANAGAYVLSGDITKHVARIDQGCPDTITEPLNTGEFTFNLSNIVYQNATNEIYRDNVYSFSDSNVNFTILGTKTQWDVVHDTYYTGSAWQIKIGASLYTIQQIMPDGSLILDGGTSGTGITYDLLNSDGDKVCVEAGCTNTGTNGVLTVSNRGRVEILDPLTSDIRLLVNSGDYVVYSGNQYKIIGFVEDELKQLYIQDYTGATIATSIEVYRRVCENERGFVGYRTMKLVASGNYETSLGIVNGANAVGYPWDDGGFLEKGEGTDDDHFKENFMIRMDLPDPLVTPHYFTIADINGDEPSGFTTFYLMGEQQDWPTAGVAGTSFSIYRATKLPFTVPEQINPPGPGYDFTTPALGGPPQDGVSRIGKDIITYTVDYTSMAERASALNAANKDQIIETINQSENISFQIEYLDGSKQEGKL